MAGLVTAARLRELGRDVVVLEKGTRAGGSMLLSSGVIWRHRSVEAFREECPGGDPELQALVVEGLDDALGWLESVAVAPQARGTGNPRTFGWRFDAARLTAALLEAAGGLGNSLLQGPVRLGEPLASGVELQDDVVLATGGFGARLAAERGLALRANPWSDGAGLDYGVALGAALSSGQDEFYGRVMPAPPARWAEADFVRAAQLYGRCARVVDDDGRDLFPGLPAWHESDLAQALADVASAWFVVADEDLTERVRERTIADMIAVAEELGADVRRDGGTTAVRVRSAVTHTLGGLRVDTRARVLDEQGEPIPNLHAAGADAGGIFTGGYGSGLAAALVLGLAAADDISS
jgi:succinate dehydrogenase/fumarate reductase flavoprotein subunit